VSYDETPTPPAPAPPPADAPAPAAPQPQSGTSGWLIAFTVVVVLALGGLAAAIISKGDSGKTTATTPTVTAKTTTVQNTTTVTTPAAPANVTVAPNVTLNSSGAPQPVQSGEQTSTAAKTTSTP
jgi:flagellar basal body-associated protein FliL